jgi:hypothetical protein
VGLEHVLDFLSNSGVNLIGRTLAAHAIVTHPLVISYSTPCRLTLLTDEEGLATITELFNVAFHSAHSEGLQSLLTAQIAATYCP